MKPGESAEETVVREIGEELGLNVKSVEYVKSYPYEKKEMLMLGFKAVADISAPSFLKTGGMTRFLWHSRPTVKRILTGHTVMRRSCWRASAFRNTGILFLWAKAGEPCWHVS
ncbi:MAG: NUDIX domain-containing protein [Lachnospiraceae bacterium]|nr:NUDIX domain-containing protein [Lachnospiraceae bacterium]